MRLIDADAWTDKIKKCFTTPNYHPDSGDAFQCIEAEQHNENMADLLTQIQEQTTAYDTERVLERIYDNGVCVGSKSGFILLEKVIAIMKGEELNKPQ